MCVGTEAIRSDIEMIEGAIWPCEVRRRREAMEAFERQSVSETRRLEANLKTEMELAERRARAVVEGHRKELEAELRIRDAEERRRVEKERKMREKEVLQRHMHMPFLSPAHLCLSSTHFDSDETSSP